MSDYGSPVKTEPDLAKHMDKMKKGWDVCIRRI